LISFKLETNEDLLMDKTYKALDKTKSDYILANILQERYDRVFIVNKNEKITILKDNMKNIEELIVKQIVGLHNKFICKQN
jgi:phosphopantothenate-cysteine ligase